jgi:hypothetical protein
MAPWIVGELLRHLDHIEDSQIVEPSSELIAELEAARKELMKLEEE